jgi:fibro-slime domain-containing protein
MNWFVRVGVAVGFSFCASAACAGDIVAKVQYLDFLVNGTPEGTYSGYPGVGHPDFQNQNCGLATGLVQSTLVNRKPVFASSMGSSSNCSSIESDQSFQSWFRSTPGINVPIRGTLTLQDIGSGFYQYNNQTFFPIDGEGFNSSGGQLDDNCGAGNGHNYAFTMQVHWTGTVTSNAQLVSIVGDQDIWLFVNNHLAIDLGGVHGATGGMITFDASHLAVLGFSLNEPVSFDLFRTNRHDCASTFKLTTNLTP